MAGTALTCGSSGAGLAFLLIPFAGAAEEDVRLRGLEAGEPAPR